MRVLVGAVKGDMTDAAALTQAQRAAILDPGSYSASQAFARDLRLGGSMGVSYPSVRDEGGACVGAFTPRAVGIPTQERHLKYRWNGTGVDRYFDYAEDRWISR